MSTTSLCPSATREHGPGAKRVLPLLFLTCLLDAAGVGLIVPLLPTLIGSVAPLAIRDAATWGAALVMTFALLQLFFSPVLGSLSDRFGRRPVLVLAMLGFALSYLLLALADSLWMLFLGRALAGLTGASVATAMACAADLGTHGQRTRHFGWLYAGLALGMILGPALGGLLAVHGTTLPLLLAAGLCLLNALLAGLFLEETLPPTRRRRLDPRRMNALRSISGLARQPGVGRLLAVLALVFLGLQAVMVVWPFFVIEKFHWSSAWIGYSLALYGVLAVLAQTLGVNLCKRRLDDARLLRLGLALQGCGLLLFALVDSSFWLVCALLPFALGSLATPAMQGLLSAACRSTARASCRAC
ncbi:MFS transporter [Pseudomonas aeruginosa]|nr:MFS transporter [Pseudomonas aeruginosa]